MDDAIKITVHNRQAKEKQALIEALREMPIVTVAVKKAGVSRDTYYRWRREDSDFKKQSDKAVQEGTDFINDMSESQLITLIKEKKLPAISLWLKHNHKKYANRIEVTTKEINEELTPEQKAIVGEALRLAGLKEDE